MRFFVSLAMVAALATTYGFSEVRNVTGFTKIKIESVGQLSIHSGPFKVDISGNAAMLPNIISQVQNSTLVIKLKPLTIFQIKKADFVYSITMPNLEGLDVNGGLSIDLDRFTGNLIDINISGNSKLNGYLEYAKVHINSSGASTINVSVNSTEVRLDSSGSAKFVIQGATELFRVDVSGASNIAARELKSNQVRIASSGASKIDLQVKDTLDVKASGMALIRYWGKPSITKEVDSFSRIVEMN